jgi:hypothetical protein
MPDASSEGIANGRLMLSESERRIEGRRELAMVVDLLRSMTLVIDGSFWR